MRTKWLISAEQPLNYRYIEVPVYLQSQDCLRADNTATPAIVFLANIPHPHPKQIPVATNTTLS